MEQFVFYGTIIFCGMAVIGLVGIITWVIL